MTYRLRQFGPDGVACVEAASECEAKLQFITAILQGNSAGSCQVVGRLEVYERKDDASQDSEGVGLRSGDGSAPGVVGSLDG